MRANTRKTPPVSVFGCLLDEFDYRSHLSAGPNNYLCRVSLANSSC